jgi:hypothetical protein
VKKYESQISIAKRICEEIIRFDAGITKLFMIKDEGIPYDGKVNFKWPPAFSWCQLPAEIFASHGR